MNRHLAFACWILLLAPITGFSETLDETHEKAVTTAREGDTRTGLSKLQALIKQAPDYYPARRDRIVILTWDGRCDQALREFHSPHVQAHLGKEPYLLVAVAECLEQRRDYGLAIEILQAGKSDWPDNEELNAKLADLEEALDMSTRPDLNVTLATNNSDQGNREWSLETIYSQQVASDVRAFVRYLAARASDPKFDTGDMNRAGVGVHWGYSYQWLLSQEFSTDVQHGGEYGSTTSIVYTPDRQLEYNFEYARYAEDLSLRAKAQGIDANRFSLGVNYHSSDYVWESGGSLSQYQFSDTNERSSYFVWAGYGFELLPYREQRLIGSVSHSRNSLSNTIYYNPNRDLSYGMTYEVSFIYDSRFDRHVDRASVYLGNYKEVDYPTKPIWRLGFSQAYDFNAFHSLSWEVSWARNVYDGVRESVSSLLLSYGYRF